MQQYMPSYSDWDDLYALVRDIFVAASVTCFLYALHRIATGVALGGRVRALREFREAYTPEEREVLIHRIKRESLKF
ncbi:MAG: hypothetical protein OEV43_09970 [Coriobacteriia bacterium]|nr:hypothetical protein [Coriobacteriia bacterium]